MGSGASAYVAHVAHVARCSRKRAQLAEAEAEAAVSQPKAPPYDVVI